MISESKILSLSIKDFFTKDILKILILPFVITLVFVYMLFLNIATIGLEQFDEIVIEDNRTSLQMQEENNMIDSIISFIFKSTAVAWIVNFLVYTIGTYAVVYLSLFISLIVIGFLTPFILSKIKKKHYPMIELNGNIGIVSTIFSIVKTFFIMLLLFIVLIPFYFIPFVNILAINLPFYYLFHKLLNFDVGTTILEKNDLKYFKYHNASKLRLRTMFLYFLSLIPFVALFLPVFYIVYLGHGYFATIQGESK
ncbi:MAG TPA: EI24 domain-containing protein [Arcobacter sp.]|nr:EI24 domain-containing protein [Arcobacter sp.]